jgi:cytochrome c oxidase assembly protein subunit 15
MTRVRRWFVGLCLLATGLALVVTVLGAYVRLADAGLGCPDWPGCYGHLGVPDDAREIQAANQAYPERPVETAKGWKEMIHRYAAGALGLIIAGLAALGWRLRNQPSPPHRLALLLLALVIGQAILGMWTVTWNLKPLVVMAHLLGGLSVLGLLWWQTLRTHATRFRAGILPAGRGTRCVLGIALTVLVGQIALGGWTSANYAALACNEFPTCQQGELWPHADFAEGFQLWHGLGRDYEYATHIDHDAKLAIHLTHRAGAIAVTAALLALAVALWRLPGRTARRAAVVLMTALGVQLLLGIANVVFSLPLLLAVAHNATAALLILIHVTLIHLAWPHRS